MPVDQFDIFLSHAWMDGDRPGEIAEALRRAGLQVWFDANEVSNFESITCAVTNGLAKSKALMAYYSKNYPTRRACQWELTAAFLAGQAEGDPRRRVLVINPENRSDHIHPVELRDAKFRFAPKSDSELAELVHAVVNHLREIDGPLVDIHPLSPPQWYGMNPVGSTRFVGRVATMWEVHSLLHAGVVTQVTGAAAATGGIAQVHGLGGVGKSLLIEEYALRFGAAYPGGIMWLRAYGNDDISSDASEASQEAFRTDQVRQIAEKMGVAVDGFTIEQIEGALGRELARRGKPCLWIVDDIPDGLDGQALRRWFSPDAIARTLITTRSRKYGSLARQINLSVLEPEEAFQLLTSQRSAADKGEEQQARELANDLAYHALALDITAAALRSYGGEPYRTVRNDLLHNDWDALELATELADVLPNGHEPSIAKTILRSIRTLGREGQDLLRLASILAVAPISASLVVEVFAAASRLARSDAEMAQRKAFQQLTNASLAEISGEDARIVHVLVSRTVRFREGSSSERTNELRSTVLSVMRKRIASIAHVGAYSTIVAEVAHARHLVANSNENREQLALASWLWLHEYETGNYVSARKFQEQLLEAFRRVVGEEPPDFLTLNLAQTLFAQGDRAAARKLQEQVLATRQQALGEEDLDTLTATLTLARTLFAQGDRAAARKLQEQVLAARGQALGEEHPDTLTAALDLANTVRSQGGYAAAQKLGEQVLATYRRVLGEEHPDTLTATLNLAQTLYAQGEYVQARKLGEQVLGFRRRVLGEEHPDTLTAMSNFAGTLYAQGDYAAARKLHERLLVTYRQVLGGEHPDTLTAMSNLAQTLSAQGDYAASRKIEEQVLGFRRRVLGKEHPDTLTAMSNFAGTLSAQGDFAEARKLREQLLVTYRQVLGDEHPDTLTAMNNFAGTLSAQGDFVEASKLLTQVLLTRRQTLGNEHPDTVTAMNDLAQTLSAQGDHTTAGNLLEQVIAISRRVLGDEHPNTLTATLNLAETLYEQGKYLLARNLEEQVLRASQRLLGDQHPLTLAAVNNLAQTLKAQGDHSGARNLEQQLLSSLRRTLGDEHPHTLTAVNNLALTLYALGDYASACKAQEHVLAARSRVLGSEHPDTLTAVNNLALTLYALGDYASACKAQEHVLAIRQRVLGTEHPGTVTAMNNLAQTLKAQGYYAAARRLEEHVLTTLEQTLGNNHLKTLTAMSNLAGTMFAEGDYAAARILKEQVLARQRRLLGEQESDTPGLT